MPEKTEEIPEFKIEMEIAPHASTAGLGGAYEILLLSYSLQFDNRRWTVFIRARRSTTRLIIRRKRKLIVRIFEDVYTNNHKKLLHYPEIDPDWKVCAVVWPDLTRDCRGDFFVEAKVRANLIRLYAKLTG